MSQRHWNIAYVVGTLSGGACGYFGGLPWGVAFAVVFSVGVFAIAVLYRSP